MIQWGLNAGKSLFQLVHGKKNFQFLVLLAIRSPTVVQLFIVQNPDFMCSKLKVSFLYLAFLKHLPILPFQRFSETASNGITYPIKAQTFVIKYDKYYFSKLVQRILQICVFRKSCLAEQTIINLRPSSYSIFIESLKNHRVSYCEKYVKINFIVIKHFFPRPLLISTNGLCVLLMNRVVHGMNFIELDLLNGKWFNK